MPARSDGMPELFFGYATQKTASSLSVGIIRFHAGSSSFELVVNKRTKSRDCLAPAGMDAAGFRALNSPRIFFGELITAVLPGLALSFSISDILPHIINPQWRNCT